MTQAAVRTPVGQYDISSSFAGRTKRDVEEAIHLLDPEATPLIALVGEVKNTRQAKSRKIEWQTDTDGLHVYSSTYTGYTTTGYAEVTDANSDYITPGDVLYCPELSEHMRVDAVGAAGSGDTGAGYTKLTVTRAFGESESAGTLLSGHQLINEGPIAGERAAVPAGRFLNLTQPWNYCQLFLSTVELTKDAINGDFYGGSVRETEHIKKAIAYNKRREAQGYFGTRHALTAYGSHATDAGMQWATAGLKFYISTNAWDASGALLTETLFRSKCKDWFRYGNHSRKVLLASPQLKERISSWSSPNLRVTPADRTYGFRTDSYTTSFGDLDIATSWMLGDYRSTAGPPARDGDYAFVIQPDNLKLVNKEPTTMETNVQNNESIRVVKDCYEGVSGWQVTNEQWHAIFYGWT